jgi:catechol 2,3-dioxygenase-like lactoylglutathione lyase family enzyme
VVSQVRCWLMLGFASQVEATGGGSQPPNPQQETVGFWGNRRDGSLCVMDANWPDELPVSQVRVARPTDQLDAVVEFYRDGLGLPVITSFEQHAGYSGVILGLPGHDYHIEFIHHEDGSPGKAPTDDNLLVLFLPDGDAITSANGRLGALGFEPVPPENPYWADRGITFVDPDGWRVVLFDDSGLG